MADYSNQQKLLMHALIGKASVDEAWRHTMFSDLATEADRASKIREYATSHEVKLSGNELDEVIRGFESLAQVRTDVYTSGSAFDELAGKICPHWPCRTWA